MSCVLAPLLNVCLELDIKTHWSHSDPRIPWTQERLDLRRQLGVYFVRTPPASASSILDSSCSINACS
jgi:hypothetical protein